MKCKKILLISFMLGLLTSSAFAQGSFREGEMFTYAIKKLGMKMGEASLVFSGESVYEGKKVLLITFTASALNFFDQEKIYVDPKTFLPVAVQRDINIWGKKEKITEKYDPVKGSVEIIKISGGKPHSEIINKEGGPLDNIYCFIYRYRKNGKMGAKQDMTMNLPTKQVTLRKVGSSRIKVAGEQFKSVVIESVPRQYKVWFGPGPQKIPLRIDGAVGMASTSLILSEYK